MNITVYGASSGQISNKYQQVAGELGRCIALRGHRLINGAGRMGLMAAAADSCMQAGGATLGIIPEFMIAQDWHHKKMTELVITKDMHERKEKMVEFSDACIALPGGVGTLEELLEIITWKQLGLYLKPIIILNTSGFYDALISQLHRAVDEKFMRPMHANIWQVTDNPEMAVKLCETTELWNPDVQKFAAL